MSTKAPKKPVSITKAVAAVGLVFGVPGLLLYWFIASDYPQPAAVAPVAAAQGSANSPSEATSLPADPVSVAPAAPVETPERQVVDQEIGQYRIVLQNGHFVDICAQAGMVKAAVLQAGDAQGYKRWGQVEHYACNHAGMETEANNTVSEVARADATQVRCPNGRDIADYSYDDPAVKRCKSVTDAKAEQKEYASLMQRLSP